MNINSGYGGEQEQMHPTNNSQEVGYLGPHERIIEVSDDRKIVFQEGDNELFLVTP